MRRTGKSQSGGNFGRGILGSIPNVEPEFGIQQSSLLGASLQTSGYDSFAGTRGLLGSMQMGNIGASDFNQTSGGLGSGASINMQQELLARQQALLLNNALAQQQQGLLSSQQGLIGSRPAGLDNGVTRLFGVASDQLSSGRGLLGSGLASSVTNRYDDDFNQFDDRSHSYRDSSSGRLNRSSESDRSSRLGRNERPREIIQIKTDRQPESLTGSRGLEKSGSQYRSSFASAGRKDDLRDRLPDRSEKRFRSQDEEKNNRSSDNGFSCHACSVNCSSIQEFDRHMNSALHRERMGTIMDLHGLQTEQQMSRMKAQEHLRKIEQRRDDHCRICDKLMYGDPRQHFQNPEHVRKERLTKRGCLLCKTGPLAAYPDYVAHIDSTSHHEKKAELQKELKQDKQSERGKSASRKDSKEDHDKKSTSIRGREKPSQTKSSNTRARSRSPIRSREASKRDKSPSRKQEPRIYNPIVAVGQDYVIPVKGYLCKLCDFFAHTEAESRDHCRSETHFQKYVSRDYNSAEDRQSTKAPSNDEKHVNPDEVNVGDNDVAEGIEDEETGKQDYSEVEVDLADGVEQEDEQNDVDNEGVEQEQEGTDNEGIEQAVGENEAAEQEGQEYDQLGGDKEHSDEGTFYENAEVFESGGQEENYSEGVYVEEDVAYATEGDGETVAEEVDENTQD